TETTQHGWLSKNGFSKWLEAFVDHKRNKKKSIGEVHCRGLTVPLPYGTLIVSTRSRCASRVSSTQPKTRLYKRYRSDMIAEKGRSVSAPLTVIVVQSLEDCETGLAASKFLRVMPSGMSPTANNATGPCINATLSRLCSSMGSSRNGMAISISMRSRSFHSRLRARNLPGSMESLAPRPLTDSVVGAPAPAG